MAKVGIISITDGTGLKVIARSVGAFRKGLRRGMQATAPEIVKEVQRGILDPPKTGNIYFINGNLHQASAPGEFPAELTGNLRMGVESKVNGYSELVVGDTVDYGKELEEGSETTRPRPHLKTGALNKARELGQNLGRGVAVMLDAAAYGSK